MNIEVRDEFGEAIEEQVGRVLGETMASQAVGNTARPRARVARGQYVNFGVTDQHSLLWRRAKIAQQDLHPRRIGFLAFEAVASVNVAEIGSQSQSLQNHLTEAHRLIGKHGHGHTIEGGQAFPHAGIGDRVVKHMRAVVGEKMRQSPFALIDRSSGTESALDQSPGPLANVTEYLLVRQSLRGPFFRVWR